SWAASLSWLRQNSVSEAFSVLFPGSGLNPLICKTDNKDIFDTGICLRVTDCLYYGGESKGPCGGGIGSCCIFTKKCDETTNLFISHFVNPPFSSVDVGTGECKLTVNPMNSNICQYRLDFDEFNILGPDASSNCVDDFFGVTGGSHTPKVCGDLTGQHMYVNVKPGGGPIVITMDTSSVRTFARKWNIKITQINCNAPDRAPAGCLQFFNETSGSVKSFNFRRQTSFDVEG
ncbi:CUB domain, partial [Trinorchestia longiramus]